MLIERRNREAMALRSNEIEYRAAPIRNALPGVTRQVDICPFAHQVGRVYEETLKAWETIVYRICEVRFFR